VEKWNKNLRSSRRKKIQYLQGFSLEVNNEDSPNLLGCGFESCYHLNEMESGTTIK